MMAQKNIENVSICLGCRGCEAACPKVAISFVANSFGDLYPTIDKEKCVNCGLCYDNCPSIKADIHSVSKVYSFAVSSKEIKRSASGGAAAFFARYYEKLGYKIVGCKMDDNFQCQHFVAQSKEDLNLFYKSKYVRSDTSLAFKEIHELLKNGNKVLFFGAPCQNSFLRNFLKGKYGDKLLLIDLICHGVPNNLLFQAYISYEEKCRQMEIKSYEFRSKNSPYFINSYSMNGIYIKNSRTKRIKGSQFESAYYNAFKKMAILRDECYSCNYKQQKRVGDITIGDFWGPHNSSLSSFKGVSMILTDEPLSDDLIKAMKFEKAIVFEEKMENALIRNSALVSNKFDLPFLQDKEVNKQIVEGNGFTNLFEKYSLSDYQIFIINLKARIPRWIAKLYHKIKGIKE